MFSNYKQTVGFDAIAPFFAAFVIAMLIGPVVIRLLRREHASQTEREEGPESHKKKSGTPTMGGFIFLLPMLLISLVWKMINHEDWQEVCAVVIMTAGFGLIGFLDDFIKVVLRRNLGLTVIQKLLLQFVVTALFAWFVEGVMGVQLRMMIPFAGRDEAGLPVMTDLGPLKYPALFFITLATVNGTNFTDGVDGLCGQVTAVVAAFITGMCFLFKGGLMPTSAAMCGALLGYLFFNVYPGRVMMGDTGSLAIGGFIVGTSYILRIPLLIPLFGFIYAAEVVSVVLQVGYFKLTKGKRLFRMAPIHHHFELGGWSETRVVYMFTLATIFGCMIAFAGIA
ncbi:MAG: phospho-N-acetylmuramoyl-pentapeptide-transferase [Lachnospiraceae bacterium]|nr:phospho-N-acetylmuramoyl-pentapeptide-transferase [Lachnospiraceae bacterium]